LSQSILLFFNVLPPNIHQCLQYYRIRDSDVGFVQYTEPSTGPLDNSVAATLIETLHL
jgi:hypothetical protein